MENQHPGHAKIRDFICRRLHAKGDTAPFDDADLLVTGGRLDSLDVVELVLFLEEEFGLNFSTIGFDRAYVDSVNALMRLNASSRAHQPARSGKSPKA